MMWKDPDKGFAPPQRLSVGGYGTEGRKINLKTNYFEVHVKNKNVKIYHYDVSIKDHNEVEFDRPLPKSLNMRIFEKLKENNSENFNLMAYDSMKSACSTIFVKQLKNETTYKVVLNGGGETPAPDKKGRTKTYFVSMKMVNVIYLKKLFESMKYVPGKKITIDATTVQMIEIMFRHNLAIRFTQIANRNFYSPDGKFADPYPIGGGKVAVTGFFGSMRPCVWKDGSILLNLDSFFGSMRPCVWKDGSILLNLDMVHTAFYEPIPLFDFIQINSTNVKRFDETINENRAKDLTKILKGIKVKVKYSNGSTRTRRIKEVHKFGPRETEFDFATDEETTKITVETYYNSRYGMTLNYPFFNCLDVGNQNKQVFIPCELCEIAKGQKVNKRLTDEEVAKMIKNTAVQPHERLDQIKNVASENRFQENNLLQALTFSVDCRPLEIEGRVLPSPELKMAEKIIIPNNGKWDIVGVKFHMPAKLQSWAIINYDNYITRDQIGKFVCQFKKLGKEKGMQIDEPFEIFVPKTKNPFKDLTHCRNKRSAIQLVMFILPSTRLDHGPIKKTGDKELNITTQCVKGRNVEKANTSTIVNILLKVNAKLGGVNNIISVPPDYKTGVMTYCEPFMIMGADVSHPAAGSDDGMPSIVAVLGSYDINFVRYAMERREQERGKEVIVEMKEIVKNILNEFKNINKGRLPRRIIMFRDGVSDSQFLKVLAHEMMAMREACTEIDETYTPGITFICVQKRHHTRLFCEEKDVRNQRNKNVPPGTIVDRSITHPTEMDFYLCSHEGIQGTSRPAHYHVLWDDNDIPVNDLQAMTYRLCHLFARCARSVSVPAPVYYAHLAALRARNYLPLMWEKEKQSSGKNTAEAERKNELSKNIRVSAFEPLATDYHFI